MEKYPVQYVIGNYLPFQIGLFLVPGLLYMRFKNKNEKQQKPTVVITTYIWSFLLFMLLFCLLPFLTAVNSFILDSLGMLEIILEETINYNQSLHFLIGPFASNTSFTIALLVIGLIVPICEELFFRGFILSHVAKTRENNWIGVLVSASIFTLLHLNWYQFLPILCFGIALGVIYVLTQSLLPGIILHALNNSVNVLWTRYDNIPTYLENYQPLLSTILIILLVCLFAVYHKQLKLK